MKPTAKERCEKLYKSAQDYANGSDPDSHVEHGGLRQGYIDGYRAGIQDEAVNALVEAAESALDDMHHYFANKCCPTLEEIQQLSNALEAYNRALAEMEGVK